MQETGGDKESRPIGKGVRAIMLRSLVQIVRRPILWIAMIGLPVFLFIFVASMMWEGLPTRIPAAIVDRDGSSLSRTVTQNLGGMQSVDLVESLNSYSEARKAVQEGKIYGFFLIPENFQADLLAGRKPEITFYTNMVYFVPGSLLFKTFKTTAVYTKAGVAVAAVELVGADPSDVTPLMQPINIQTRGIGNPGLNYGVYLSNSFIPGILQLMIMLVTVFTLGQEVKYHGSRHLMEMSGGSIVKALFGKLFPQTIIWLVMAIFMVSFLYRWCHYPMNGSWGLLILSEILFVIACQSMGILIFGLLPDLRLGLSVCALLGILNFSLAAYSFPVPSMYGAIGIFSYILPGRYNFLIYSNVALNALPIYYSRVWFAVYLVFPLLTVTVLKRIKRIFNDPIYCP